MIKISPSILASDFSKLGEEALSCERAGADMLHIDVMDGHFVPNITLGAPVVKSLRKVTKLPFDVHLMISDPEKYIPDFAAAGADIITFHIESGCDAENTIRLIKSFGIKAGIVLKPSTPAEACYKYLQDIDMILVMTVEPGFGGQSFMEDMMPKIRLIRDKLISLGLDTDIETDGGITDATIIPAAKAGANVFVAGSYIFKAADRKAAVESLKINAVR